LSRSISIAAIGALLASTAPALAGETPLVAPAPAWVTATADLDQASIPRGDGAIPLFDAQTLIDGGQTVSYVDAAQIVGNAGDLQRLGTFATNWQPAHGDLTLHRVEILRDGRTIDLLKDGAKLTVLRREAGLESQIIDGSLTAMRQIEGLRIGDIVRVAYSISNSDDMLGGKAQAAMVLLPRPMQIGTGRARLVWPQGQAVDWRVLLPGIAAAPKKVAGKFNEVVVPLPVAELPKKPGSLPARFQAMPLLVAGNFAGWSEVAAIMAPLYRTKGLIAQGSDLARVTDGIAAAHSEPVARMAEALRVVQSDVRYLLVAMGAGNYEPQPPAKTWEQRFGDCKAKTLLLLAMLDRLGIEAEPVLANSRLGDMVPQMLPAAQAFDHVFVHARAGGEDYWLDGTGIGARLADIRDVPRFGNVLPVRAAGSALVQLPQRADARPSPDIEIAYDATTGVHLPVPFTLTARYAGAAAERTRASIGDGRKEELDKFAASLAKTWTGSTTTVNPGMVYDAASALLTVRVEGLAYPDWDYRDGRLELEQAPVLRVSFEPDRSTSQWRALPALIDNPWTARLRVSLALPPQAANAALEGDEPLAIDLPAVSYRRSVTREGATIVDAMASAETGAEVPAEAVSETKRKVTEIGEKVLRITLPADYPWRWDEVQRARKSPGLARMRAVFDQRIADKPDDAERLTQRAWLEERLLDWKAAEALHGRAIAVDASTARYLARARVRSMMGDNAGALADARAAHDLDPGDAKVRAALASALVQSGKSDEALELIDARPDIASDEGEGVYLSRVDALERGGHFDEALAMLDAALKKRASAPNLLNARCYMKALAMVDLTGALTDCTRAIELSDSPAPSFDSRAMVHFRAGRMAEALADIDSALMLEPELAETRFLRGLITWRESKGKAGAADMDAARRLKPAVEGYYARYGIKP